MSLDPEKLKICVHCGLCLEACPTYRVLKNEADSPRGRILLMRGVQEGRISMTNTVRQHLDACLDCRACETACPAGVPYGELIEEGRAELYPQVNRQETRLMRFFLKEILAQPARLKLFSWILRFYQKSGLRFFVRKSLILKLFPSWVSQGESLLPDIPTKTSLINNVIPTQVGIHVPDPRLRGGDMEAQIALLRGCMASVLFPQVEQEAVKVLERLGCSVRIPENQTCCGALLLHAGFKEDAKVLAQKNLEALHPSRFGFIVVTAAGCGATLKEYKRILPESPEAALFSEKVRDISQVIAQLRLPKETLRPLPLRVAYQDACHLAHAQGVREEPRALLKKIPQLELLELPNSDWCCGSAGIYNLTHPDISNELLKEKINSILSVNPDVVAVGNPGCSLQIRMGLEAAGSKIPVLHPIELLSRSLMSF